MWPVSFICMTCVTSVRWLIHHLYVWHSCGILICNIHMCDMHHSYIRHTCCIHIYDTHMCDVYLSYLWHSCHIYDMHALSDIHQACDMTHASFMYIISCVMHIYQLHMCAMHHMTCMPYLWHTFILSDIYYSSVTCIWHSYVILIYDIHMCAMHHMICMPYLLHTCIIKRLVLFICDMTHTSSICMTFMCHSYLSHAHVWHASSRMHTWHDSFIRDAIYSYGVASTSRLLKITDLFCRISSLS